MRATPLAIAAAGAIAVGAACAAAALTEQPPYLYAQRRLLTP
jgi:hypothetical protein